VIDLASIQVPLDTVLRLIVWADVCVAAAFLIGVIAFGTCCGAEGVRERRRQRRIRTVLGSGAFSGAMLLALGLAACTPQFQHLDGTALHPIAPPLAIDKGWLVVDSSARGVQALVELQLETEDLDVHPLDLERISLRFSSSDRWQSGRVRVEGPICAWSGSGRLQEPRTGSPDHEVNRVQYGGEQRCMYIVRAQFDLDRLPTPGDSVVVSYGQHLTHLAWR